jgi:glutathione S-transferase
MTVTIWARRSSSCAQKVFWTTDELGIDYKQIDAGRSFGITDTPEYLAKNPNGLVPTLEEDNGFVLWESNAIIRYLAAKHGEGGLWPADLQTRASADRWMDWGVGTFGGAVNPIFVRLVLRGEALSEDEIKALTKAVEKPLRILSDVLERHPFVAGEILTVGDVPIGMYLNRWFGLPIERPDFPLVTAYYQRLLDRPAYRRNVVEAPPVT